MVKNIEVRRRTTKTRQQYILTNDPSMTAWGWAVVDPVGYMVIDSGAIKTEPGGKKLRIRKGDDRMRRVSEINAVLLRVIKQYNIGFIFSELPHGSQSASAAVMIGIVAGIIQTISDCLGIGVEWYSEGDAKRCVSGKRSVAKDEMVQIISKLYDVSWKGVKWNDQAVADALAVFHVARQQSNVLKLMK